MIDEELNDMPVKREEEKLCDLTKEYLSDRQKWESRQDIWYKMRNHGLRRKRMPFPNAADLHYPLIDSTIDKVTPFYLQQFQSAAQLADFIPLENTDNGQGEAAKVAKFFDYYLKHDTNFEDEQEPLIDNMLMSGRGILKIRWDAQKNVLDFEAMDPLFFVVPSMTKKLQDADFVTEIIQLSKDQYKHIKQYRQGDEYIKKLLVKGDENGDNKEPNEDKYIREGITSPTKSTIVIWQTYRKEWIDEEIPVIGSDAFGNIGVIGKKLEKVRKVRVYTYAPHMPNEPIREPFILPYNHNDYPFVDFPREEKEHRWYASRGIPERLAPFEVYLCKVWNEKSDAMTFYNSPIYTTNGGTIPNAGNVRFTPGSVFTAPIQRVDSGTPPVSFDQEMINTRATAEALEQTPDFGMGKQTDLSERRTATEIQAISQLSSTSQDTKAGLFRKKLKEAYQQAWILICQYAEGELAYIGEQGRETIQKDILKQKFDVTPAGASNAWNKQYKAQVALQMLQLFRADPNINQIALIKMVIEALVPEKLSDLILDPIHEQRIKEVLQELQSYEAQGGIVPPQAKQNALAIIQQHFNAIKTANPQAAAMLAQQLGGMMQPQEGAQNGR
ncbi:MAG: hypothetical protein J6R08_07985 [Opitutales bacterium]|nr:hypothetical protein [Opitutales bacterium]